LKGGDEFLHRLAVWSQAGWKDPPIPAALHDGAAIARQLVRQILLRASVTLPARFDGLSAGANEIRTVGPACGRTPERC